MLKFLPLTTILPVFLCLVYPAVAANWVRVTSTGASTSNGFDVYVDPESIKAQGALKEFWGKAVYYKAQKTDSGRIYEQSVYLESVDCAKKTWGITQRVDYDQNGLVVLSHEYSPKMELVVPGTVSETVNDFVCRRSQLLL